MKGQEESETKPTQPPFNVLNAINLPPRVQSYVQVDEKRKDMSKPYFAEPINAKTISHNAKLSKLILEAYNTHSS